MHDDFIISYSNLRPHPPFGVCFLFDSWTGSAPAWELSCLYR